MTRCGDLDTLGCEFSVPFKKSLILPPDGARYLASTRSPHQVNGKTHPIVKGHIFKHEKASNRL